MTQEQAKTKPTPRPAAKTEAKPQTSKAKVPKRKRGKTTLRVVKYAGIPLLFLICLYIGLYIGYVKLGKQPASEIWEWKTWRHIYDLIFTDID
ncbi:hypothetical protein PRECH8_27070 [Insulibacter thermoxylanivorax]|uniref:DNA-directed RNA polymerase subunit beta n=1 Tax=Insulibacter thermoxylanivorax TaxID=2749268 RepID=A0A916VHA3_9BACL|nr:DNA-directed RNA polymerase subunit beta [Insulibacter thermoxylanivorax]GFR39411.1 hypothetical protein PRECH8_27070 [Insulibacter thermoxylanivorax]